MYGSILFQGPIGKMCKVELSAYIVLTLEQDLIRCKSLTKNCFLAVLDSDLKVSGVYPKDENGEIKLSTSFSFEGREDVYILQSYSSEDAFQLCNGY